tara:strand:- start:1277 stop:2053 length:777 start_codon:yes stop_codon:yes gene_type:complete
MPFLLHNTRIKIVDDNIMETGEAIGTLKDGREVRTFCITGFHIDKDKRTVLKEGSIFNVLYVSCKSDHITILGELNDIEGFSLEQRSPASGYLRGVEIEFPNEGGELEFQNAETLFKKLGAMPYQSDYRDLEYLIDNYKKEHLEQMLYSSKIVNETIRDCEPGELAQFIYYIIHRIYYERKLSDSLPESPDELLDGIENDAGDCLKKIIGIDDTEYRHRSKKEEIIHGFVHRFSRLLFFMKLNCPIIVKTEEPEGVLK